MNKVIKLTLLVISIFSSTASYSQTIGSKYGPDVAYIQQLIVKAIENTPVNQTAIVTLPVNPRTGTKDWYFPGIHGSGITIPRSNFIFDGAGAKIHAQQSINSGGTLIFATNFNGEVFGVNGLIINAAYQYLGFTSGKIYKFPNASGAAIDVIFQADVDFVNTVKSISGGATSLQAKNITVSNLTIVNEHQMPEPSFAVDMPTRYINSIGVDYADNVYFDNVKVLNSPQSGFAVTAEINFPTTNITFNNCSSVNSYNEAYRFKYTGGVGKKMISGTIQNSSAIASGMAYDHGLDPILAPRKTHVFYIASGGKTGGNSLSIINSYFDSSAEINAARGAPNLLIRGSQILGGIALFGEATGAPVNIEQNGVSIIGNHFECYYAKTAIPRENCVWLKDIQDVSLTSNYISGNRTTWYYSNQSVTDFGNYWLN